MEDESTLKHGDILVRAIGRIRTPFVDGMGTPIQPAFARGAEGQVIVDEPFVSALDDLEGFERIWLLFWMDRTGPTRLRVVPYRDTQERGLFATRAPCRPNPIGLSVVRLLRREGHILCVSDVDMLDNTPLIDIKPYLPEIDAYPGSKAGWFQASIVDRHLADRRFHSPADDPEGKQT
ncbi:MAG: tRNA (N6-threonylcarbamoyladenosine(37)-N6)-methyltransferase TrmO [Bradymonadales bacterium]|nr:tRNA (N6-threonylcarbamoyladenosine(37)-N6)-methyltransferase TrmO [Bradymonadales bacterium]